MSYGQTGMMDSLTISHAMREKVRLLGSAAIARLRAFGLDDRREAALTLMLAGGAPMAAMLLLGWPPLVALTSLLLNLLVTQVEDIWKFLRAAQPWSEVKRECVQDQFVWRVAVPMALGNKRVYFTRTLPTEENVDAGKADMSWAMMLTFSVLIVAFVLFMLQGSGALYGQGREILLGSLPNALAGLMLAVFHGVRHDVHSTRAASVRMQNVLVTATLTNCLAMAAFFMVASPPREDIPQLVAVLSCAAVVVCAVFRLYLVVRLGHTATWLEQWLARAERLRVAKSPVLPVS